MTKLINFYILIVITFIIISLFTITMAFLQKNNNNIENNFDSKRVFTIMQTVYTKNANEFNLAKEDCIKYNCPFIVYKEGNVLYEYNVYNNTTKVYNKDNFLNTIR